jgi:hypothetical protein
MLAACCGSPVFAQQDAAQKATEGAIDHWIEYYKEQRGQSPAPPRQQNEEPRPPIKSSGSSGPSGKPAEPIEKNTAPR